MMYEETGEDMQVAYARRCYCLRTATQRTAVGGESPAARGTVGGESPGRHIDDYLSYP
jgi:hypothetical protein